MAESLAPTDAHDEAKAFVMQLGEALHRYGASAPRVEQAMELLSARFDFESHFFATPTSIFAAFGKPGRQNVGLLRVEPGQVDLAKRCELDDLITDALHGRVAPRDGLERIALIQRTRSPWSAELTTLCYALASAASARFLGGTGREMAASLVVGLAIGVVVLVANRSRLVARVVEPLAAFVAASLAVIAASQVGSLSTYIVTVSGLIVFLPGLTMTTAMQELAVRHLAAGTARFMGGAMTLVSLAFGVALGRRVADLLPPVAETNPLESQTWSLWLALVIAPLALGVLLRARARDLGWIVAAGWIAFFGARAGAELLGPELGAFFGAFVVGAAANVFGRVFHRSSVVAMVPGILILVPGSIGFRSLNSMLERDVVSGVATGFTMLLVAISLVAGLLFANVAVSPRRLDSF